MPDNLISKIENALLEGQFKDGLSSYTQSNCQVSITSDKTYKIYRPPNKNPSTDGNTMWGGLIIKPIIANPDSLQKGHKYILKFEVKGKTSNSVSDILWSNNAGWSGGGLNPNPSNVRKYPDFGSDWISDYWTPFEYYFEINDDVYKVCTSSYSSFVAGQTYPSYRDFKFGFGYTDTGDMGTELYLRNFRMYDVTTKPNSTHIEKEGVVDTSNFVEIIDNNASIRMDGEVYTNELIEL